MAEPQDGYLDKAFEDERPSGRTRIFRGNRESLSRDDPRLDVLASQVNDLLARVDALEIEVQELRGDVHDAALTDDDDDAPPPV